MYYQGISFPTNPSDCQVEASEQFLQLCRHSTAIEFECSRRYFPISEVNPLLSFHQSEAPAFIMFRLPANPAPLPNSEPPPSILLTLLAPTAFYGLNQFLNDASFGSTSVTIGIIF
ncbi:MAG: hypothetical protein IPH28_23130 [Cytophagaceae bacterium]|nr:hypothetical protein [Cytophagaceae bacterium]